MKYILISILLVSVNSYAFDLQNFIDRVFEKANSLMDKEADQANAESVVLPKIPDVIKDAKSTQIYDKTGTIYLQGDKYNNLSDEEKRTYRIAFVQELYFVVYGAEATKDKLAVMLNILEKGGSREGIYRSLVLNNDYANLESFEETPKDGLLNAAQTISQKFMNKSFEKSAMLKLNSFSIKKIMTEKMLEVMDSFPSDGKDLRSWYAVFSSDLAKDYPKIWTGPIRGVTSSEIHFKWAGSVPLQHIKSELIIKIHKLMNFLQG